jgi:hypothetical protein
MVLRRTVRPSCQWCSAPLLKRKKEAPRDFRKRKTCNAREGQLLRRNVKGPGK